MDPFSRIFSSGDPKNLKSAKEVISHLESALPACIEILKSDPEACAAKIENLRERVSHFEAGEEKSALLGQLVRCRVLFNELIGRVSPSSFEVSPGDVSEAIERGDLGLALHLIKTEGVLIEDLKTLIEPDIYQWIKLNLEFSPTEPPPLDEMALASSPKGAGLGWGYKAANLAVMRKYAEEASLRCSSSVVRVPEFIPLSDIEMRYYILAKYPDLERDWRLFQATLDPEKGELIAAGIEILEKIQQSIITRFEKESYVSPQLLKWLETHNPDLLAVRSTGKEDSKTTSTAGGNDTELYVAPNPEAISKAIGKVLSSYFGEKSIRLRLAKGDPTIFTEELFLPVLIQTMVSKPEAGGVLFTGGDLGELVELSVVCGHPHGAVSGEATADRFLLDTEGSVAKSVRSKRSEFRDGAYQPTSPQNRDSPAISDDCARDMRTVASYFSREVYRSELEDEPLDMEFSVEKGVIHLLQARPLIRVSSSFPVSYINLDLIAEGQKIAGKTLLSDGSYVRNNVESIVLCCDTLEEAEKRYMEAPFEVRGKIATVIVRRDAPTTSHAAVNLRAAGIGALVIENPDAFKRVRALIETDQKCFIDLQQGVVVHQDDVEVLPDYVCFPIPLEYSIAPSAMIRHNNSEEIKAFAKKLDALIGEAPGPGDKEGMRGLLHKMSIGSEEEVKIAAANLLYLLRGLIRGASKDQVYSAEKQVLLMITEEITKIIERQLLPAALSEPRSLKRLYPVRLLEACIYQESDVIGGFSIKRTLEAVRNQKKLMEVLGASFSSAVAREESLAKAPYVRARLALIDPRERELFDRVITNLHLIDPIQVENIGKFFHRLSNLGILTEWTNRELGLIIERGDIHTVFEDLLNVARNSFEEMKKCERTLSRIRELRTKMTNWEDPQFVQKNMHSLILDLGQMGFSLDSRISESFIYRYALTSDLGKLAILETMRQSVDLYDEMIKTVKASKQYPTEKGKVRHFKAMLHQYRLMMQIVLKLPDEMGREISELGTWGGGTRLSVGDYLHAIDAGGDVFIEDKIVRSPGFDHIDVDILTDAEASLQTLPTKSFDVSAIIVTGAGDFQYSRAFPGTLEDYFTLFHQNMIASIGRVRNNLSIPEEKLPEALRRYKGILGGRFSRIDLRDGKIVLESDIPVRQHAAKVQVSYDLVTGTPIVTKISFFGANEWCRWEYVAATLAAIGEDIPNLELETPKINYSGSGGVTLEIIDRGLGEKLIQLERFIAKVSYSTQNPCESEYYCDLVRTTRESFGLDPLIPFSLEDLKRGAFFIAPMEVYQLIQAGNMEKAKALLEKLRLLQTTMPYLSQIKVSGAFFPWSSLLWGEACLQLESLLAGISINKEESGDLFELSWSDEGESDTQTEALGDFIFADNGEDLPFRKDMEKYGNLLNRSFTLSTEDRKIREIFLKLPKADKKMALQIVAIKGAFLTKLGGALQEDLEVIETAVAEDCRVLDKLNPKALHNLNLAFTSSIKHPEMLLRFSEEVRSHPALVEDIVRKCAAALQFAGPELRRNQTLAEFAWRFDS